MKSSRRVLAIVLCWVLMACAQLSWAATAQQPAQKPSTSHTTPGIEAARTLSMITGVAISPLLGVGAIGAYTWWNAPVERRARLDWYAQPWFWVSALLLVVFVAVKDILGAAAPSALKKPFDVAETIENKISGLVAAGAFLPLIISVFPEAAGGGPEALNHSAFAGMGFATLDAGAIGNLLLIPFAIAAFVVVFLASNAINILILLSPFTCLDTALKGLRIGVLSLVGATAFLNAYVGAAVALGVIVFSYLIAGWSFRLTIMGTVYVWDFLTFRRHRFQPGAENNKVFTARTMQGAPVRTYGRLRRGENGGFLFVYRPWLFLQKKQFNLNEGPYVVGRGMFYPEISLLEGDRVRTRFVLSPCYNGHEEALARAYSLEGVRDVGILRGYKAAWRWMRGLFNEKPALAEGGGMVP